MLKAGDTFRREDDWGRPDPSEPLLIVCCDEFGDQAATCGDLSHEVDAEGVVTIDLMSMDYGYTGMRFCPWCAKRFEVAPA